jgi:hypothetical protein
MPGPASRQGALTSGAIERSEANDPNGAGDVLAREILTGTIITSGGTVFADAGSSFSSGAISSDFDVAIRAAGTVDTLGIDAGDDIVMLGTTITTGALTSGARERTVGDQPNGAADLLAQSVLGGADLTGGGYVVVDASEDVAVSGTITADFDVALRATDAVTTQAVTAGDDIAIDAGGAISTGDLASGGLELTPVGARASGAGDVLAQSILPGSNLATGGSIVLDAGATIGTGAITSDYDVAIRAVGAVTTADVTAGDDIVIGSGGDITTGALASGSVERARGDNPTGPADVLAGTDLTGGGNVFLLTDEDILTGPITGDVDIALAGGSVPPGTKARATTSSSVRRPRSPPAT